MVARVIMDRPPVTPICSLIVMLLISTHYALCTTVDRGTYELLSHRSP